MKFAHKVFHIDKYTERSNMVLSINQYLSNYSIELETPSIEISNLEDIKNFIDNHPDFIIDRNGYNLDNVQGWKMGEIGILASNYTAWKNFLNTDYDILILMEDDIEYNDNFFSLLTKYISELPENWDMFSFFVPADQYNKYNLELSYSDNTAKVYQDWSCLCYLLSRSGAEKSISLMNNNSLPLDWFYYRQKEKFNIFSIKPDSQQGCTLAKVESTFQSKHTREIINGIF